MSPERYQQIKKVALAALELEGGQRTEFLDKECGSDNELRREVERLLEEDQRPGGSIEQAIAAAAAEVQKESVAEVSQAMLGRTISHYEIVEKLGEGGMGKVYFARDTGPLDRKVALKFMSPEIQQDPLARLRFLREAKSAAALDHPYICHIHEVGEEGVEPFFCMEYVAGQTLGEKLDEGPLPLRDTLGIATEVAEALEFAHKRNIVHRDLKPANIMLTPEGHVKVMDFGLAKWLVSHEDVGTQELTVTADLTQAGATLGTPAYMSPEQLRGKEVDTRSDIFSFGVVLYEMLTGVHPFRRGLAVETANAVLNETEPVLTHTDEVIPPLLQHTVTKMLAKEPANRHQHVGDVRVDLKAALEALKSPRPVSAGPPKSLLKRKRWIPAGVLGVLILGFGGYLIWHDLTPSEEEVTALPASQETLSDRRRIVVLPFENLGVPEKEYFTDGMTDEITSRLGILEGLRVTSRTSAMQYKESRPSMKQIGEELGVDYVLEGTVRWDPSSTGPSEVLVTPRLIQVSEDTQQWSKSYTEPLADIFKVQSDIAKQVIEQLGIVLLEPQRRSLEFRPTENLDAYDSYLRGNRYLNRSRELHSAKQLDFAIPEYKKAVLLDPTFALAYARLAVAHGWYCFYFGRTVDRLALAQEAVDSALEIDPGLPEAHYAKGLILSSGDQQDRQHALIEFQIVLKSQPSNAEVFEAISKVEMLMGQWKESLPTIKKAIELDPRLGRLACWAGGRNFGLRHFNESIRYHDQAIRVTPDRSCPYYCKALIYLNRDGSTERARGFLEQLPHNIDFEEIPPINYPWVLVHMMDGRYQEALKRLSAGSAKKVYVSGQFYIPKDLLTAQIYGLMDRPEPEKAHYEAAKESLEAEVKERDEDDRIHSSLGIAYAGLGRNKEAIQEGKLGLKWLRGGQGIRLGYRHKDLAQIYLMVGDHDKAIDHLEELLSVSAWFSAPYFEIDPTWNSLRESPRFLALLQKYGATTASRSSAR